jgi:tellurite resistance protein
MSIRAEDVETFDEPKLEALVEMMVLAASADGEFQDEERARLERALGALAPNRMGGGKLESLMRAIESRLAAEGRDARLSWVKTTLGDEAGRKVALELAIHVMAADGILRTSERELILETAEALEIDRDVAADMVRAVSK